MRFPFRNPPDFVSSLIFGLQIIGLGTEDTSKTVSVPFPIGVRKYLRVSFIDPDESLPTRTVRAGFFSLYRIVDFYLTGSENQSNSSCWFPGCIERYRYPFTGDQRHHFDPGSPTVLKGLVALFIQNYLITDFCMAMPEMFSHSTAKVRNCYPPSSFQGSKKFLSGLLLFFLIRFF